jgi:hypothetical protein
MPFWQTLLGRIIRWMVFLPIGFGVAALLEAVPLLGAQWAAGVELKLTLLSLLGGLIALSILGTVVPMWFMAVYTWPTVVCAVLAPRAPVAAVIFGTLFVLFQGLVVLGVLLDEGGIAWLFLCYKLGFSAVLIAGMVTAHSAPSTSPATAAATGFQ